MQKLRIGHIGTRHDHSSGKLDCVRKLSDVFEVVGVVEEDPQQLAMVKEHPSYRDCTFMTKEQLFNAGCDAIMVEGSEYDLPHVALECIENGIPVHIDKPAGRDLQAFEKLLRIAKEKHLPVQMAYMYRYNPAVLDCMEMIRQGRLGRIHSVSAIMNTGHPIEKRQWLHQFDGGIMYFLGCHMVDLVYQLQGTPDSISTYLCASGIEGTTAIDQATAVFCYPGGHSVVQANSCEVNGYGRRQLVVCGTEGTYEICPLERPIGVKYTHASFAEPFWDRHTTRDIPTVPADERYDDMMLDFAAMVRNEKENPVSYEDELQVQKLVLAASGYDVNYHDRIEL